MSTANSKKEGKEDVVNKIKEGKTASDMESGSNNDTQKVPNEYVKTANGRVPVIIDGGFRTGGDVLK